MNPIDSPEAQAQAPEPTWRSDRAHEAICEAAEAIANRYCDEDDTYYPEVKRLTVAISEVVDRTDAPRATPDAGDARRMARDIIGNVNNYAEDNGELSISAFGPLAERIAAALTVPRATAEAGLSVESALAELREIFPDAKWIVISGNYTNRWNGENEMYTRIQVADSWKDGRGGIFFNTPTLSEAMNQAHAWAKSCDESGGE